MSDKVLRGLEATTSEITNPPYDTKTRKYIYDFDKGHNVYRNSQGTLLHFIMGDEQNNVINLLGNVEFKGGGVSTNIVYDADLKIDPYGGSGNTLVLTTGENVGIGTTAPSVKLEVVGSITSSGVVTASGGNSTNWNTAYSERLQWDGYGTNLDATAGVASLGLDLPKMATQDSGNVSITGGVISGLTSLDVTGPATLNNGVIISGEATFAYGNVGITGNLVVEGSYNDITATSLNVGGFLQVNTSDPYTGVEVLISGGDLKVHQGSWDEGRFILGAYYFWVYQGSLRMKLGAPSSATDGTVVGP